MQFHRFAFKSRCPWVSMESACLRCTGASLRPTSGEQLFEIVGVNQNWRILLRMWGGESLTSMKDPSVPVKRSSCEAILMCPAVLDKAHIMSFVRVFRGSVRVYQAFSGHLPLQNPLLDLSVGLHQTSGIKEQPSATDHDVQNPPKLCNFQDTNLPAGGHRRAKQSLGQQSPSDPIFNQRPKMSGRSI